MMMDNYREQIEEALADQTWPSLESVITRPAQDRVPAAVLVGIIESGRAAHFADAARGSFIFACGVR